MAKSKKFYVYPRKDRPGQWWIGIRKNGQTVGACSRDRYKHLDGDTESNVRYWIGQNLVHPEPKPRSDIALTNLVKDFVLQYTEKTEWTGNDSDNEEEFDQTRAKGTLAEHKRHLLNYIIPYFLSINPPLKDPNHWPSASVKMYDVLKEKGLTKNQIYRCNVALRRFFKWLKERNEVLPDAILLTRNPSMQRNDETTPLKTIVKPEEAIEAAKKLSTDSPDIAKFILLSMFFSLRPQECFGVRAGDFRAGNIVVDFEESKAMQKIGLFGRYLVNIRRQRTKDKTYRKPKKGSKGWVACYDKDAALLLHRLIGEDISPDQLVIECTPNEFYKAWTLEYAPKDLRRSSLYYLGMEKDMTLLHMMKHARQRTIKSLMLYLRTPEKTANNAPMPKASDFDEDKAS